ncbi:MAG: c-type cytochrome [Anaerolineae bacterium]
MKKVLKWIGIGLGSVVGVLVIGVLVVSFMGARRLNRTYAVTVEAISIPTDEVAVARGEHLATAVSGCNDCHAKDYSGQLFFDDPTIGQIYATNLTAGQGGIGAAYTDEDWVRALTHGVAPDGRMLMFMPAQHFRHYSDAEVGAIIAYMKTAPPVDNETPLPDFTFMGRILFALNALGQMPAEMIDHKAKRPSPPPLGVTAEYGELLVTVGICKDCHGANLAGGRPGPNEPWAPNLTPGGRLGHWAEADFVRVIREGKAPDRQLSEAMPWQSYKGMTDEELQAIWLYLSGLDALAANEQ